MAAHGHSIWGCLLLVLVSASLHQRSKAVPKRDVDHSFLAYSLEFDGCKDITDFSPRDSIKAADDACQQAFYALDRIKQNTCQNWRDARCRVITGQNHRQCSCLVSHSDDSNLIPTSFRECAKNIASAVPGTRVEEAQTKKKRKRTHDDAQTSARKRHVSINIESIRGVGPSIRPYTSGGADSSAGVPIRSGASSSDSAETSAGKAKRRHHKGTPREMEKAVKRPIFPCTVCPKSYKNLRSLNTHIRSHTSNEATCPVCHEVFSSRWNLDKHIGRRHPGTPLPEKAKRTFPGGSAPKIFPCPHCPRSYAYERVLRQHLKSHLSDETKCPVCHKTYSIKANLKAHIEATHPGTPLPEKAQRKPKESGPFICGQCGSEYANKKNLRDHVRSHDTLDTHCFECKQTFGTRATYLRHLKSSHPADALAIEEAERERYIEENPEECGICHKRFKNRDGLREHRQVHDGRTQCEFCGQVFTRVTTLNNHKAKAHANELKIN